ncbi:hypothetical protein PAHAL_5G265600 [Panicum hallii]|uniref:Uncharacterized protein n=1 Tax=Panicum hallii TaxID=206008 RepID=A0A2S3HUE1_9POAL|nr:hypothetical protein PAHAL_5G265600 [Panicum hallii]
MFPVYLRFRSAFMIFFTSCYASCDCFLLGGILVVRFLQVGDGSLCAWRCCFLWTMTGIEQLSFSISVTSSGVQYFNKLDNTERPEEGGGQEGMAEMMQTSGTRKRTRRPPGGR